MYHFWKIFHAATKGSKILHATTITQSSQKTKKNFFKMTLLLYEAKDNIPGQGQHSSTQVLITWPNVGHRAGAWHKLPSDSLQE